MKKHLISYVFISILFVGVGFLIPKNNNKDVAIQISNPEVDSPYFGQEGCFLMETVNGQFISHNAYKSCLEGLNERLKANKTSAFKEIEDLVKSNPNVFLINTEEFSSGLMDWYKDSEINNEKKCVAENVWSLETSGFESSKLECQILATKSDVELLKNLQEKIKNRVLY